MVFLLGTNFSERQLVRKALTSLYGISSNSATSAVSRAQPRVAPHTHAAPAGATATSHRSPHPTPAAARHNLLDRLLARHSIHPTARMGALADRTVTALTADLTELTIENELRRRLHDNIRRLRDMGAHRGRRHAMGLPVRGQRTRTQVKTAVKLNRVERRG